jgi:hypothetical protein
MAHPAAFSVSSTQRERSSPGLLVRSDWPIRWQAVAVKPDWF